MCIKAFKCNRKKEESFEAFYTLWWRRQATLKTPNQERAETKQDATPTD